MNLYRLVWMQYAFFLVFPIVRILFSFVEMWADNLVFTGEDFGRLVVLSILLLVCVPTAKWIRENRTSLVQNKWPKKAS